MTTPSSLERFSLAGKVVVLTGGAGLYGRGLTADLAAAGATTVIASRNLDACRKVADEENRNDGGRVVAETYDQSSEDSIRQLLERVLERFGRVDGLVNNAVARPAAGTRSQSEKWAQSLQINGTGLLVMHRHFGEAMARQETGGSIVNIGSIYGVVGPHFDFYGNAPSLYPNPDYFFHKAGMVNLSRYYAALFGPKGVRVNTLSPGGFYNGQEETFVANYTRETYLGRMGDPRDLGGPVVFLLSEAARYVTGVNLPVDGGFTAR
ncbi:MAG TPA: SDR family oxidoreductase [Chthoniobacteraceae bacterium]|nr:SDR family oxidoreductase [Chthoniobacteraceae bacterium]